MKFKREHIVIAVLLLIILLLAVFYSGKRADFVQADMQRSIALSTVESKGKEVIKLKNDLNSLEASVAIEKEGRIIAEKEVERLKKRRTIINTVVPVTKSDSVEFLLASLSNCDSVGIAQDTLISHINHESLAKDDVIINLASTSAILESQVSELKEIAVTDGENITVLQKKLTREERRKRTWRGIGVGVSVALATVLVLITH